MIKNAIITKIDGGFSVSANGHTQVLTFGVHPNTTLDACDIYRYGNGHVAFTRAGLTKLTALGLHERGAREPRAAAFIASATAAPTASPAISSSSAAQPFTDQAVTAPPAAASEPSFLARARDRYGIADAAQSQKTQLEGEPDFARRMRDRYAALALPDTGKEKAAEPDFAARMKARHGVGGNQ